MRAPGGKEQMRRRLFLAAQTEVKAVLQSLPAAVKQHAKKVPVIFEMVPHGTDIKSGIEPDTLGLFNGASLADSLDATTGIPPEIILYMENIWEMSGHDATTFREEIRRTYLHELGHYLGLDEDDLYERDLD